MADPDVIVIRALTPADLPGAQVLTAGFGWPHQLEDWRFMHRLGRGLVALRGEEVVGTAMSWLYGHEWASLGLIGVSPTLQGQGLGRRLIRALMDELQDRRVLLHATEAGLKLYRDLGFQETSTVHQYQSAIFRTGLVALPEGERLRPLGRSDPAAMAELDRGATGIDRSGLIAALLKCASTVVLDRQQQAVGFAMIRPFGRGHVIGPVVAPDVTGAKSMILHLLGSKVGQFVRIDIPRESGLATWLEELSLADAGPAIRMVRGDDVRVADGPRSFALVSQALG